MCRPLWEAAMPEALIPQSPWLKLLAQVGTIGVAWIGLATGRPLMRFNFGTDWATLPAACLVLFPVALFWVAQAVRAGGAVGFRVFLAYGAGLVAAGISVLAWMGNAKMDGVEGDSGLARALSGVAITLWVLSVAYSLFSILKKGPTRGASGD